MNFLYNEGMKLLKGSLITYSVFAYLPYLFLLIYLFGPNHDSSFTNRMTTWYLVFIFLSIIAWLFAFIVNLVFVLTKKSWDYTSLLLFVSIVKSVLVPFYVLNFAFGFLGLLSGLFTGIGFLLIPILLLSSFLTMVLTSLSNAFSIYRGFKEKEKLTSLLVLLIVSQFLFVLDLIFSWVAFASLKSATPKKENTL